MKPYFRSWSSHGTWDGTNGTRVRAPTNGDDVQETILLSLLIAQGHFPPSFSESYGHTCYRVQLRLSLPESAPKAWDIILTTPKVCSLLPPAGYSSSLSLCTYISSWCACRGCWSIVGRESVISDSIVDCQQPIHYYCLPSSYSNRIQNQIWCVPLFLTLLYYLSVSSVRRLVCQGRSAVMYHIQVANT